MRKWKGEIIECFMICGVDFMDIICIFIFRVSKAMSHFLNYHPWYLNRIGMNERTCPFSSYRDSDADRFPDYRRGLHGLRRGLHGLQARITRITGADYADYITPITRREILARTTTPSNLNNNNQYLFLLLSHLHIYDENILYSWYMKVET